MVWSRPAVNGAPPSARCAHTATACGGKIFVFGGWNGSRMLNDLHVIHYSPEPVTLTWVKPVTNGAVPEIRAGHAVTAVGAKLFVFGGGDGAQYLNDLHILDTETMSWSQAYVAGTSPGARSRHTCTLVGNRLLVFGGGDDSRVYNDLYVLNTDTMSWSRPTPKGALPPARWGHTSTMIDDYRLLVFGGHDGTFMLNDVNILDTQTMTWTQVYAGDKPAAPVAPSSPIATTSLPVSGAVSPLSQSPPSYPPPAHAGASLSPSPVIGAVHVPTSPLAAGTHHHHSPHAPHSPQSLLHPPQAQPPAPPLQVPSPRAGHTATLAGGRLVMFGGGDGSKILNDCWFFHPATLTWTRPAVSGASPPGRCAHTATLLPESNGRLLVFGGGDGSRRFKDSYVLDMDLWTKQEERRASGTAKRPSHKAGGRKAKELTGGDEREGIEQWLSGLGMKKYADRFTAQEIDMELVVCLTEQHLIDLGIPTLGARLRILNGIKALKAERDPDSKELLEPSSHEPAQPAMLDLTSKLTDAVETLALATNSLTDLLKPPPSEPEPQPQYLLPQPSAGEMMPSQKPNSKLKENWQRRHMKRAWHWSL